LLRGEPEGVGDLIDVLPRDGNSVALNVSVKIEGTQAHPYRRLNQLAGPQINALPVLQIRLGLTQVWKWGRSFWSDPISFCVGQGVRVFGGGFWWRVLLGGWLLVGVRRS
jgi:hypothetical protein